MRALTRTNTAKIGTRRHIAQFNKRLGQNLRDLVVERAAVKRMRMRHQREAAPRRCRGAGIGTNSGPGPGGIVKYRLDLAGRTVYQYALGFHHHRALRF